MADEWIYAVHGVFWATFLIRVVPGLFSPTPPSAEDAASAPPAAAPTAPADATPRVAPWSQTLVAFHTIVAFGVLYAGVARAVFSPEGVPEVFPEQRLVSIAATALGAALVLWALVTFRSWRIRAKIDPGHQLVTSGPFALLRNPIYLALDLIALATAIWIPTPLCAAGFALVVLGGDLRARAEERVLEAAFGQPYLDYKARVKRFLPGLY